MKKNLIYCLLVCACAGLGMSMPSCSNEQLQQKVDALQASQAELTKKVQTLTETVTALNTDMTNVKQLLPQMTNIIQTQKNTLEQLDATVKEMQSKNKKPAPKKKH